ncbi:IS21 family transposase [Ureibacillus chungkukjangi]|uniref:IS21 family transposase n=1 Tax=Ureibacillus chungkukjangi TaxID=1202712 RepID=UPI000D38A2F8|nr:IS21 family transposase [Ureibacillus chungkukjangi]
MNKMERWNMYLEIQQLKKLGLNKSQIARRLGISRNTVYKYINMTPEEFEDMLEHMEVRQKKLDCIKEKLITWLKQYPDISSAQIHDWIKERYPDLTVGESTVRCYVSQLRKEYSIPKIKVTRQYEAVEDPPMGQQMQVDFGQVTVRNTFHQPQKLWFMACVLSHSRYKFVYWLDRPFTTADVIQAHEQAFVFYGGLPQEIVYDQDHLILVSENGGDLIYTKEFANYLKHRAFKVRMCRKGDPESKGKVENVVGYVKKNFARHRIYYNLAQWSEDCLAWLERTGNGKVHQTTKKIPAEVFQQERLYLRPVQEKYHLNEAKASITRVVRKDNTILYAGNRYSVPLGTYDDKGKSVGLKIQDDTLTIYDWETGEVLAQHAICHEKGKLIQNTNHKRDRSKGIQALMQQVAGRFPEPDQATLFLKEIYQRKQRYMRDQLQKIQEVMNKANPHSGVIGQALAYCLTYQLYSAAAFSDAVQHFMQQAQRQQAHQHEHQPEIKPTVLGHQSHSQVKAEIRDPQVYIRILEGESLCQKA